MPRVRKSAKRLPKVQKPKRPKEDKQPVSKDAEGSKGQVFTQFGVEIKKRYGQDYKKPFGGV